MDIHEARILAIDDNPINRMLLRTALGNLGYANCETEADPMVAVARIHAENFDLVLLDFNMPNMSGLDVLAAIGERIRRELIPVIMVTAQIDRATRLLTLSAGAKDFIPKPIDIDELRVRVSNLLETRSLHLELRDRNDQLESKVIERNRELHSTRLEVIRRLARAAEFRDNDTGLHVQRMSLLAATIGRRMGLGSREIDLLLNACPMHDIGKIGISDLILLKPGKLTAEELELMRQHTTIGADILQGDDSDLLRMAHDIALHHHERWDGAGYPHGLSGQAIPLMARIAAVADVFDALTMDRPYKRAWLPDAARAEIVKLAGSHFDPEVIAAFDAVFEEMVTVH